MPPSETVREIRRLGCAPRIGAIVLAEQAVDTYADAYLQADDRRIALDILFRDLARLRAQEPALDRFIGELEGYIGLLHRDLSRRAA